VLTGKGPLLWPIRVSQRTERFASHSRSTLTIQVEPWVSAASVTRAYRELQRESTDGDNRPLALRTLTLLQFLLRWFIGKKRDPTWEEVTRKWNRAHPTWSYADFRAVRLAYFRTGAALLFPATKDSQVVARPEQATVPRGMEKVVPSQAEVQQGPDSE